MGSRNAYSITGQGIKKYKLQIPIVSCDAARQSGYLQQVLTSMDIGPIQSKEWTYHSVVLKQAQSETWQSTPMISQTERSGKQEQGVGRDGRGEGRDGRREGKGCTATLQ